MTKAVRLSRPQLGLVAATISLLFCGSAWAQTAGGAQSAAAQAAHVEWRRLPQSEINCVDQTLRAQRSGLWVLIQQGISPSDPPAARIRTACRTQANAPDHPAAATQRGSQAMAAPAPDDAGDKTAAAAEAAAARAALKAAADKAAADKAAAEKAAAEKAAAEKAAADKAAADKAAAEKAVADKVAAEKLAAEKAAMDKAAAQKAAAEKAAAEKAAMDLANAERAKTDALAARAEAERPRKEAAITEAALDSSLVESRMSFIYGLISGPILFVLGGAAFLLLSRRKNMMQARPDTPEPDSVGREKQSDFDRLVAAVLAEQRSRNRKRGLETILDRTLAQPIKDRRPADASPQPGRGGDRAEAKAIERPPLARADAPVKELAGGGRAP